MRPNIYRVYSCGTVLQQTIGETAGRGANIETDITAGRYSEILERACQFFSPARDIARGLYQFDDRFRFDQLAGFVDDLLIHLHTAGKNQRLRFGTSGSESVLDE